MNAAPPNLQPRIPATLPFKYRDAAFRGVRGNCPRCGGGKLFGKWLRPVDTCRACGQNWTAERADDFPAYIAILVTGHVMAPILIALIRDFDLSPGLTLAVILPLAIVLMLALLQPAKGAVLATMWWSGMGSFAQERPLGHPDYIGDP